MLKTATASVAVSGDRAHYAMDFASNLIGLAGIGVAAWLGFRSADAIAALAIAAVLLWGAVSVFREASGQLMDHELPDEARSRDRRPPDGGSVASPTSTSSAPAPRSPIVHMQMHIDLDPDLTLEAAHQVIVAAENRLLDAFPSQADIIIRTPTRARPGRAAWQGSSPRFSPDEAKDLDSAPGARIVNVPP